MTKKLLLAALLALLPNLALAQNKYFYGSVSDHTVGGGVGYGRGSFLVAADLSLNNYPPSGFPTEQTYLLGLGYRAWVNDTVGLILMGYGGASGAYKSRLFRENPAIWQPHANSDQPLSDPPLTRYWATTGVGAFVSYRGFLIGAKAVQRNGLSFSVGYSW